MARDQKKRPIENQEEAYRRPLIIASSGGGGHIAAANGIIHNLKIKNPPKHKAMLYKNKPFSMIGFVIRIGVLFLSIPIFGALIRSILRLFHHPVPPDYKTFWTQMDALIKGEQCEASPEEGRERPYVDMLLDINPAGYELTAFFNATQLNGMLSDLQALSFYQGLEEQRDYQAVYRQVRAMLIEAANKGQPYTSLISTQALSLDALCDVVHYYNTSFLRAFNQDNHCSYEPIFIKQYLTDLPERGCTHFLKTLSSLRIDQKQWMEVHAVHLNPGIERNYLQGFRSVQNIKPHDNPMLRSGFKQENLSAFADKTQSHSLQYQSKEDLQSITIGSEQKVASIMLGSLASLATSEYVKHLLDKGYDRIFVFGGLNEGINQAIEAIIDEYPDDKKADIQHRIIRLGYQKDAEIAPIMTRSDCVIIRSGGLTVMEQMALPVRQGKQVFIHHASPNKESAKLTSGLSWEDSNANALIAYLTSQNSDSYAGQTSPNRFSSQFDCARDFRDPSQHESVACEPSHSSTWIKAEKAESSATLSENGLFSNTQNPIIGTHRQCPTVTYRP